jgi:transcription elongation factor Elf1
MSGTCPFCGSKEWSEGGNDAFCGECGNSWLVEDRALSDDRDEVDDLIDDLERQRNSAGPSAGWKDLDGFDSLLAGLDDDTDDFDDFDEYLDLLDDLDDDR